MSAVSLNEYDWVKSVTGDRLHHAILTEKQDEELNDSGELADVETSCGLRLKLALIPGVFSRMAQPRCGRCCDRLGYPHGTGSPKNDPAIRPLLIGERGGR